MIIFATIMGIMMLVVLLAGLFEYFFEDRFKD